MKGKEIMPNSTWYTEIQKSDNSHVSVKIDHHSLSSLSVPFERLLTRLSLSYKGAECGFQCLSLRAEE